MSEVDLDEELMEAPATGTADASIDGDAVADPAPKRARPDRWEGAGDYDATDSTDANDGDDSVGQGELDAPVSGRWQGADGPGEADDGGDGGLHHENTAPAVSADVDTDPDEELTRIIEGRLVNMMYQPITSLLDDSVVGYEALARGPEGSSLCTPAAMFEAAEVLGRQKELDLHCQAQAVLQARDVLLQSGHALFVNVEGEVLCDAAFGRDLDAAESISSLLQNITAACPVVLEVSDVRGFESPQQMVRVTRWARKQGFRVAIDDVGVDPMCLAVLPLIEPDVIKLERGITTAAPDAGLGELLSVVRSQSERTGAAIVCQGIETDADREVALSFGATHVQGFGIGLPEELSDAPLRIRSLEPVGASWGEPCSTPFELVANSSQVRTGTEDLILALTLDLERQAAANGDAVILASFESTVSTPGVVASRYEELAASLDFVMALGTDLGTMKGVFGGGVGASSPMAGERSVVVMTPQFSAALLARLVGGTEGDRRYAFAVVHDRGQVTRAARMLASHVDL